MELWETILLALFSGIVGFFSNQILHNLAVKKDNIQVNRDRLLLNIYQVDNFIKSLIELQHIRKELSKIRDLSESSDTSLDLLSEQTDRNRKAINDLEEELKKLEGSNKLIEGSNKLIDGKTKTRLLSKELSDTLIELSQHRIQNQILRDDLDLNAEILNDLNRRKYSEDFISALLLIDPTGEIIDDISVLIHFYLDSENSTISDTRMLQSRLKIERFINKKISTFK